MRPDGTTVTGLFIPNGVYNQAAGVVTVTPLGSSTPSIATMLSTTPPGPAIGPTYGTWRPYYEPLDQRSPKLIPYQMLSAKDLPKWANDLIMSSAKGAIYDYVLPSPGKAAVIATCTAVGEAACLAYPPLALGAPGCGAAAGFGCDWAYGQLRDGAADSLLSMPGDMRTTPRPTPAQPPTNVAGTPTSSGNPASPDFVGPPVPDGNPASPNFVGPRRPGT